MNSNFKTSQARKEVRKEILNWSSKKATKIGDIPTKILKKSVDIYLKEITFIINDCIENGIFPDDLKLADTSPKFAFKKVNYRRLAYYHTCQKSLKGSFKNKLILSWLQNFLHIYAQYLTLKMIETWEKHLDKREKLELILMDLSEAFDTINHSYWQN